MFRSKFVASLEALRTRDRWLAGVATKADWPRLKSCLCAHDWVVYAEQPLGGPGGKMRTLRVPGTEFIGRFLQHVLPVGFKRIRHYGLLSPALKKTGLPAARAALSVPPPEPAVIESVAAFLRRGARSSASVAHTAGAGSFRFRP